MRFATGYASSMEDLLVKFPYDKLTSIKGTKLVKKSVVKKMFKESIKAVLLDIIDNNDTFILPAMGSQLGEIHMEVFLGNDFKEAKKRGQFKDIDFLESDFKGYMPFLYMKHKDSKNHFRKKKPIYVNKFFKDLIVKNTNEGKLYS